MGLTGLTPQDVLLAAVLAFIITFIIKSIAKNWNRITSERFAEFPNDDSHTMKKCYSMFPNEVVTIQGKLFKRGMMVRIVTSQHKIIEGKLVGTNSANVLCVITRRYIVAHEIDFIESIMTVETSTPA